MSAALANISGMSREAWLELRRQSIGASDAPAILGKSRYKTRLEVWASKMGLEPDEPETPEQRRGRRLEPLVVEDYQDQTGMALQTQVFARHPVYDWMTATLDGVRPDGRIVEVKTVGPYAAREWGEELTDSVPDHVLIQVQHQMLVANQPVADVAALFGGERFKVFTVAACPDFAEALLDREAEFWGHVQRREPPPPGPDDVRMIDRLFPPRDGVEVMLGQEHALLADLFDNFSADRLAAEKRRDAQKALLLAAMGEAQTAFLPDGRTLKRSVVDVKEHTVKALKYVRFTVSHPKARD